MLEGGLQLYQVANIPVLVPQVAPPLGAAYARVGRAAEAMPLLEQAVEQAASMRRMGSHSLRLVCLGEVYLSASRMDEAITQALGALELSRTHKERGNEAWALRLLGAIALHDPRSDVEPAEDYYRQALALAEELDMRPLLAHCHRGLGTLY